MLAMGVLQTLIFFPPKCKAAKASRACELVFLTRFFFFRLLGIFVWPFSHHYLPSTEGRQASKQNPSNGGFVNPNLIFPPSAKKQNASGAWLVSLSLTVRPWT
jgi:hypothetical protein